MEYKSNNNVVYSCKYHVVWCPKYRRRVLVEGVDERFKQIAAEVAAELGVDIIEMEVMPDHVHMLMEVDPQFGVHKAVKAIKGRTSRAARRVPVAQEPHPVPLDEQLLRIHRGRGSPLRRQAVHRGAEEVGTEGPVAPARRRGGGTWPRSRSPWDTGSALPHPRAGPPDRPDARLRPVGVQQGP